MDSQVRVNFLARTIAALLLGNGAFAGAAYAATTVTHVTYDGGDHVTSVTDPRGLVTTYVYDGLGQLWQQTSPDTGTTNYGYDSYGRRSSLTRADGTQTIYGYDGVSRMVSLSAGGQTQTFTYDNCTNGAGRLCADSDATGTTSYSYTPEGWVAGRAFSVGGSTYALGYSYNALGNPTAVVYPDGNQALYSYTQGVVSGLTLTVGTGTSTIASAIRYDPMDAAMSMWASSNGLVNTLYSDSDGRLYLIRVPNVQSLSLTYDNADRITQISNGINGNLTQNFGYDDQSRLTSLYSVSPNVSYQYDANGNRITQVVNGVSTSSTISPTSNQLVSTSGGSTAQYGYDPQGNLTTLATTPTYHYNAFNRMDQAGGTPYYVNPEGQRLRKQAGGTMTYFAPDQGGALLAENQGGAWTDYLWLNGRLIGRLSNGQLLAIHDDQLGRPEAMTDASGAVVWRAQNLPFTRNVISSSVSALNLGFPGQYYDSETGYWNNGFRDYDPRSGRYIQSDPIGQGGGINTYVYAMGNPVEYIDPAGLDVKIVISNRTYSFTGNSIGGTISVTSDQTSRSFSGYTMENAHAGDNGDKGPIPEGTYNATVRTDHSPNRVELQRVPGYDNIQIHNGSYPRNFKGCFGAGSSHRTDFLGGTVDAMNQINDVIQSDGTGNISVIVGPVQ